MHDSCIVRISTTRKIQRMKDAKLGLDDKFSKGMHALTLQLPDQIIENKRELSISENLERADRVSIIITDGTIIHEMSNMPDMVVEVTTSLTSNGVDRLHTAQKKLKKIILHHFKDAKADISDVLVIFNRG